MKLALLLITTIVFLLISINLFVTMVIFLGEDYHVIDQIKIYQVFEEKIYKKIRNDIMKQNYTILIGDDKSGVKNFIEHQANLQTLEGHSVVIKRYQSSSSSKKRLLKKIKETRFYLELAFGLERGERTEVFFVKEDYEIPYEQVAFIRQRYPTDNIIIVCPKDIDISIDGFKQIKFPPVNKEMLRIVLSKFYSMKKEQANRIFREQNHSIEQIFNHFKAVAKQEGITAEELLEIEQIQGMNDMSHEMAERQAKKLKYRMANKKKVKIVSKKPIVTQKLNKRAATPGKKQKKQ